MCCMKALRVDVGKKKNSQGYSGNEEILTDPQV